MGMIKNALAKIFKTGTDLIPPMQEAPSAAIKPLKPEYRDDTILRALAESYRRQETSWIFASDLDEFYHKLDAHNADAPMDQKIYIRIHADIDDALKKSVEEGAHLKTYNVPSHLTGQDLLRHMGPTVVDGLKITAGNVSRDAFYRTDMVYSSCLSIVSQNGAAKEFHFGIDYLRDEFKPAAPRVSPSLN